MLNCCSISYTCYFDSILKINIKALEYKRLQLDLTTFYKLVKFKTKFKMGLKKKCLIYRSFSLKEKDVL